jgi:hypothetical protein
MARSSIAARKRTSPHAPATAAGAAEDAQSLEQARLTLADAIVWLRLSRRAVVENDSEGPDFEAARSAVARGVDQLKAAAGKLEGIEAAREIVPGLFDGLDVVFVVQAALSAPPPGHDVTDYPMAGALGVAVGILEASDRRLRAAGGRS